MNLLGGKGKSMTNRLVVEQENNINREFRLGDLVPGEHCVARLESRACACSQ